MKKVLILGATGMVGGLVLREALGDKTIDKVILISRRKLSEKELSSAGQEDESRLEQLIIKDFKNHLEVEKPLKGITGDITSVYFCLGAYTGSVPDKLFKEITFDYVVALVDALKRNGGKSGGNNCGLNKINFCLLSGAGADQSEKSKMSFARYKGQAENFLLAQGFKSLTIFRPGYIYPVKKRKEPNVFYALSRVIYQLIYPLVFLLNKIGNGFSITSVELAKAMFVAGLYGIEANNQESSQSGKQVILENRDIYNLYEKNYLE